MKIAKLVHTKHHQALHKNSIVQITTETIKSLSIRKLPNIDELSMMFISNIVDNNDNKIGSYGMHTLDNFEISEVLNKTWKKWLLLVKYGNLTIVDENNMIFATDTEDFIDEDTGEVVSIELTYAISYENRPIKPIFFSNNSDVEFLIDDKSICIRRFDN